NIRFILNSLVPTPPPGNPIPPTKTAPRFTGAGPSVLCEGRADRVRRKARRGRRRDRTGVPRCSAAERRTARVSPARAVGIHLFRGCSPTREPRAQNPPFIPRRRGVECHYPRWESNPRSLSYEARAWNPPAGAQIRQVLQAPGGFFFISFPSLTA